MKYREHHITMDFLINLQQKVLGTDCIFNLFLKMNVLHFVVLRRDLLSETELKKTENVYKSGPYDPEMYRFPEYNIKEYDTKEKEKDTDVTNQLLNSALALDTPGMTKNLRIDKKLKV